MVFAPLSCKGNVSRIDAKLTNPRHWCDICVCTIQASLWSNLLGQRLKKL